MRLLRYALNNIARSIILSFSSITVIALMTFLIFVLFLVEFIMQGLSENVNARLSLKLYVKTGFTSTSREVVDTIHTLEQIAPGIQASFSSAEENLNELRQRDPDLAKVVETDAENPLKSTISIKNVPIEKYEALDAAILEHTSAIELNEEKHKKSILGYRGQYEKIRSVVQILHSLRYGLFGVIGFFLFSVFVVIFHSIGNAVFFFREEIKITELVGGQKRYIYGPFVLQGMIYSIIALCISGGCFYFGLLSLELTNLLGAQTSLQQFFSESAPLFLFVSGAVIFLGALSGLISSWRFVR
jgi:cell division transport system permease protein